MKWLFVLSLVAVICQAAVRQQRRFPDDFRFGLPLPPTRSRELGMKMVGKGENIWDYMTHTNPTVIKDVSNGDIAADSYHNYKRDVEMMRELGLDTYRFSLFWSRILPSGFTNEVNPAGIEFYNNYINEMLKYNIEPMVTLYHWDLPQKLQELGGWMNPLIIDWFEDYARVAYENFGDRVKLWITFNEPREVCYQGYGSNTKAPILNATAVGTYLCAKHLVLAHAKSYHLYNNEFKPTQGGQCGITHSINWYEPDTNSPEDAFAVELRKQGEWGIYLDPIYSEDGGFGKDFAMRVAQKSAEQGYKTSRLPEFTEEEKALAKGASDFLGVNHYTGYVTSATEHKSWNPVPSLMDDIDVGSYVPEEWPQAEAEWLTLSPNSLFKVMTDLKARYNDPILYVTENGWATANDAGHNDDDRIAYYKAALEDVLDCLDAGVRLKGYMAWSLMDNFEWMEGYTERFGLYHVDFEDPQRTRTPRKSAFFYKNVLKIRYIDHDYEPESMTMTIDEGH